MNSFIKATIQYTTQVTLTVGVEDTIQRMLLNRILPDLPLWAALEQIHTIKMWFVPPNKINTTLNYFILCCGLRPDSLNFTAIYGVFIVPENVQTGTGSAKKCRGLFDLGILKESVDLKWLWFRWFNVDGFLSIKATVKDVVRNVDFCTSALSATEQ